ncbi:acylase [Pseudomonas citronellolis]|uniref:bifunctional acylase PvdQ n=1 Tax=Pseudomonas citronellolis TaxID=53408 RepID=UPI0023E3B1C4|nr:acylase [Pseudomonas citronellolis]MDF3931824.1 acylase [Pseudomonas citronellolis]
MSKYPRLATLAGLLLSACAPAFAAGSALQAQIRWTRFGIPHIEAADERGLGYGIGYAYARDNACLLAEEIVTARGERSRWFGLDGRSSAGVGNLASDFFFTWLNDNDGLRRMRRAQPRPIRDLLDGYAAGFNRWLRDNPGSGSCAGQPWRRPIDADDLLRLTRRLLVQAGAGQFAEAMLAAAPPGQAGAKLVDDAALTAAAQRRERFAEDHGSNAIAVGSERSADGGGLLLANPHFPWYGALRFYQMHLRIPGQLDVMGAALPGMPLVNIGFSRHLAWSHTVDTSSHFTLYRLALDPQDNRRYQVDGQSRALMERHLQVQVREADGSLGIRQHVLYESEYGPLLALPGKLPWNASEAYAIRDANLDNTRVLQQWYAIDHARSLDELRDGIQRWQGIPWVNTLAADAEGRVLYLNQSVVPYLSTEQLAACALDAPGLPLLRGDRAQCAWSTAADATHAGLTPPARMPALERRDFVQNSNDSAWLSNPAQPLSGFSPLVSRDGVPLGPRARFALNFLQGSARLGPDDLQRLVTGNHVYLADLLLDDLLALCQPAPEGTQRACAALAGWDRSGNLDSGPGFAYFQAFAERFGKLPNAWRVPFDPRQPLTTPSGVAPSDAARQALQDAAKEIDSRAIRPDSCWGQLQRSGAIGIPGGSGQDGVYNAIHAEWRKDHYEVLSGSSYIQLVRFTAEGPQARGLLAFSQSSEPTSPHHDDQTRLFARGEWPALPFSEAQIAGDPDLEVLNLREP